MNRTSLKAARSLARTCVFVGLCLAGRARADVVRLEAVEAAAVERTGSVRARESMAAATRARIRSVRADMMPALGLDLGMTAAPGMQVIRKTDDVTGDTVYVSGTRALNDISALQPFFRYSAGLRFDGPIYDFGRTAARVDAARADADATDADVRAERQAVIRAVRTAYVAWLAAYELRVVAESARAIAVTRASQIDEAIRAGARAGADRDGAAFEVARAELVLARLRADEDDARGAVAVAAHTDIPIDAIPDRAWLEPADPTTPLPIPAAVAAIELRREALGASLRAYRRRYNPVLGVSVRLGLTAQSVDDASGGSSLVAFPAYSIQVGLSMPLWDPRIGSQVREELAAREAALEATEADLRATADVEFARARLAFERASEQLGIATEMVRLADRIATAAEERFRTSGGSLDTVLAARARQQTAEEERIRAELELATSRLRLMPLD